MVRQQHGPVAEGFIKVVSTTLLRAFLPHADNSSYNWINVQNDENTTFQFVGKSANSTYRKNLINFWYKPHHFVKVCEHLSDI